MEKVITVPSPGTVSINNFSLSLLRRSSLNRRPRPVPFLYWFRGWKQILSSDVFSITGEIPRLHLYRHKQLAILFFAVQFTRTKFYGVGNHVKIPCMISSEYTSASLVWFCISISLSSNDCDIGGNVFSECMQVKN